MNFDFALRSTRVVLPDGVKDATVFIKNGKIDRIAEGRVTAETDLVEDLGDAVIMPGVIDAHVHINEPGRTEWEGFETATRAAAAGGVTTLIEMPLNASPVTTTVAAFDEKVRAAEGKLHVDVGFYGGLVPDNLADLPALMAAGVFGIKCFLTHSGIDDFPNVSEADLRRAMPLIRAAGLPLLAHAELDAPHAGLDRFRQNPTCYADYLGSRPCDWENRAIELLLRLCRETRCRTHIVHLSSADLLDELAAAKRELPLTVETATHYLYFAAEDIPDAQCVYKCAPPIRDRANQARLWQGLRDGTIDFIGSDHSPAPPSTKELESGDLAKAWGGIAGLQFTLPAVWTRALVRGFGVHDVARWLCAGPAAFLGLRDKGRIAEECVADLIVWEPEAEFTVQEADVQHRHKATPYRGERLRGQVRRTYLQGQNVYQAGSFTSARAGKVLLQSQ
jgi:allantoinase